MQLPTGDKFDYGLPGYLESGVVNLLNALNVPAIVDGVMQDGQNLRASVPAVIFRSSMPIILPQSSSIGANGALEYGSKFGAGTVTFGATSGSTTATFSAPALLGNVGDVLRVIIVDGGKKFTITAHSSTTVATGTISGGTLSGLGPFATWQLAWPLLGGMLYPLATYQYFPAGAVYAGSLAGMYYVEMINSTSGTVYDDICTTGIPIRPANPTPIVSASIGAFTQSTAAINLANFTLKGGLLGPTGDLHVESYLHGNHYSAGSRQVILNFGGSTVSTGVLLPLGPTAFARQDQYLVNMGSEARTLAHHPTLTPAYPGASNSASMLNINTAVDQIVSLSSQLAVATDFAAYLFSRVTVTPGD